MESVVTARSIGVGLCIVAYLLASVPFGLLLCRARGIDLRRLGSGNIGATNASRALGRSFGILVMLLDCGKGWLPVALIARIVAPDDRWAAPLIATAMAAAVAGHVFSLFLRFRGGKGVATGLGVTLAVAPTAGGLGLAVYLLVLLATRVSAMGSLAAVTSATAALWLLGVSAPIAWAGTLTAGLIFWRHRDNIRQMVRR